jgi:hypothetical protein
MLKHVYKGIILLCVFAASLYYFSLDMKEEVVPVEKTVQMSKASFPIVTIKVNDTELNQMHGYSNTMGASTVRESITPLDRDQSFTVVIDEKENDVKRVIYELRSVSDQRLLKTDTINALDKEGDFKTARIKLDAALDVNEEYAVKITLVTIKSKKMNYYTRVKLLPDSNYKEKLDFAMDFHNTIMDKEKAEDIIRYLEPDPKQDNSNLAYVNIHSSFDLVSWGNLKPQVIGEIIPTFKELSPDMGSIELKYRISAETDSGLEYYNVHEFYRVRYTSSRMYLLNYERRMESVFDINLTSLAKSQFKVGITNQEKIDMVTSGDDTKLAFVRERELWYYNLPENDAIKVFSFRQEESDNVRDMYDQHNVRILNLDDNGNIDFIVYGYMNRGVYEGRVGIVLYRFYSGENRIEELVYIPTNVTYQILKEQLGDFSYVNQFSTFYFTIHNTIYAYNLITSNLTTVATDISNEGYVVSKENQYLAFQNSSDPLKADTITILDLETGAEQQINAPKGSNIRLLGKIHENIVYGFVKHKDITTTVDGEPLVPMYQIRIADYNRNVLKDYKKSGYYITDAIIEDNIITLIRVEQVNENGKTYYKTSPSDNILNKVIKSPSAFNLAERVTDLTLTEQYISLPSGYSMEEKPKAKHTLNTIISRDTTLRLKEEETLPDEYVVYALGEIEGFYDQAGEAIEKASSLVGTVLNGNQEVIWERGVRKPSSDIKNIVPVYESDTLNSIMASALMLVSYQKGGTINSSKVTNQVSAHEFLSQNVGDKLLNLTGCALDDVLYYVSDQRPVLALKNSNQGLLIVGYDSYNITVIDPVQKRTMKLGLNDSMAMFEAAGNVFISYKK